MTSANSPKLSPSLRVATLIPAATTENSPREGEERGGKQKGRGGERKGRGREEEEDGIIGFKSQRGNEDKHVCQTRLSNMSNMWC